MHTSSLISQLEEIAEVAALSMVRESATNVELRNAITTVRLGDKAVRIGDWDILAVETDLGRSYDIRSKHTGEIKIADLPFYDTATMVVGRLNDGSSPQCHDIKRFVRHSGEFNRLMSDVAFYTARVNGYRNCGDENKAELIGHRLGAATARLDFLRFELTR